MNKISESLVSFTNALEAEQSVAVNRNGSWRAEGFFMRTFRKVFKMEDSRIASVCHAFNRTLDDLEKIPPQFNAGTTQLTVDHQEMFDRFVQASRAVSKYSLSSRDVRVKSELRMMDQKITSLRYRLMTYDQDEIVEINEYTPMFDRMLDSAREWKKGVKLFEGADLTELDEEKLEEVCRYPEFVNQLEGDPKLRELFFKWIIRYNNPVRQFVEYPERCQRISQVYLAQRVGRFAGEHFKIQTREKEPGIDEKVLTLPFELLSEKGDLEVKDVSILDESKVLTLRGGYQASLDKIFAVFNRKEKNQGDFEFFGDQGIINWNSHYHAWKNAEGGYKGIDYLKERWWEQLPVFEVISKEELEERYELDVEEGNWVGVAKSTAESLDLDVDRSHGYLEVAIPIGNDEYQILDFGKFAEKYPDKALDYVTFLANTFRSHLEYPDSNEFFSQRQHAAAPFELTPEKGRELMVEIQRTLIRSEEGNLIFQFAYENCAWWPQHVFKKILGEDCPNFFYEKALNAKPSHPLLGSMFRGIRKAPKVLQKPLLNAVETLLVPWRGVYVIKRGRLEKKTLAKTPFGKDQKMWHPGALHQRIKSGTIKGVVYFGHQLEKIHVNR